jgi:hypothetical protein
MLVRATSMPCGAWRGATTSFPSEAARRPARGRLPSAGQYQSVCARSCSISGEDKTVATGDGGIKFWMPTADAKTKRSHGVVQKVPLELLRQNPNGNRYVVKVRTPRWHAGGTPGRRGRAMRDPRTDPRCASVSELPLARKQPILLVSPIRTERGGEISLLYCVCRSSPRTSWRSHRRKP